MNRLYLLYFSLIFMLFPQGARAIVTIGGVANVDYSNDAQYIQYVRFVTFPQDADRGGAVAPLWANANAAVVPATITAAAQALRAVEDHFRGIVWKRMQNAFETLTYPDTATAGQEMILRGKEVGLMHTMNSTQFFWYGKAPFRTTCNLWEYPDHGAAMQMYIKLPTPGNAHTPPWDAIQQISDPTEPRLPPDPAQPGVQMPCTMGDCYDAIDVCIWYGQAQALGQAAFNAKWAGIGPSGVGLHVALTIRWLNGDTYANKMTSLVPNSPKKVPYSFARRGPHLIPGDWLYFKNSDYHEIISYGIKDNNGKLKYPLREICQQAQPANTFLWSGENAILSDVITAPGTDGGITVTDHYLGLDEDDQVEDGLRDDARDAYNMDLAPLFPPKAMAYKNDAGNTIQIRALVAGPQDDLRLQFVDEYRVHL